MALVVKNPPVNAGDIRDTSSILGWEGPLEEGMATHSSILAWRIPWTEEPGGLQPMGSQKVRHDLNDLTPMHANWNLKRQSDFAKSLVGWTWKAEGSCLFGVVGVEVSWSGSTESLKNLTCFISGSHTSCIWFGASVSTSIRWRW